MIELVTLEEAKDHLRIDTDAGDADLKIKIQAGSAALISYIQGSRNLVLTDSGDLISGEVLLRLKSALLILLGWMDRNRGAEEEERLQQGELPFSVTMMIYDLRKPSIL